MDFEAQLRCKRPKCEGVLTIPIKIVVKGDLTVILTHCYKCKTKYKVKFFTSEHDQWIPLLQDLFYRCDNCGAVIPGEWKMYSASSSISSSYQLMHRDISLANTCPVCKKNSPKVIDDWLWSLFKSREAPLPKLTVPASATNLFCRNCGSAIVPGSSFCVNCGSKV